MLGVGTWARAPRTGPDALRSRRDRFCRCRLCVAAMTQTVLRATGASGDVGLRGAGEAWRSWMNPQCVPTAVGLSKATGHG
jgi:hypothetical protein